ncbi:MAG: GAF domain-containing protein [Dehalococcoidia bacterium]|nr:GAF domain-containing protein [Dehalococcoidia bacterium]
MSLRSVNSAGTNISQESETEPWVKFEAKLNALEDSAERCHFTVDDIHFVGAVANLGAIALENARLYESVRQDKDQLSRELLEWHAAMGLWPPRLSGRR